MLPLPNLDTRRWADLVEEGRALVPRYAPEWTDHNIHDPGITLIELFAWLVEREMYRANRVPAHHRRKFLELIGFPPEPPRPAFAVLSLPPAAGTGLVTVPAGLVLHAAAGGADAVPFSVVQDTTLIEVELAAVQVFDGTRFTNRTRATRERMPFPALGADPRVPRKTAPDNAPALYLGFDRPLPVNQPLRLYVGFGGAVAGERVRLRDEYRAQQDWCAPPRHERVCVPCPPMRDPACADNSDTEHDGDATEVSSSEITSETEIPRHHAARVMWEYYAGGSWHLLDPEIGRIADDTRALTLDGSVSLTLPAITDAIPLGAVSSSCHWVRCRLVAGSYDATPVILALVVNAVDAAQRAPAWRTIAIAAGAIVTGAVLPGTRQRLSFTMTPTGTLETLAVLGANAKAPELLVLDYTAPTATVPGAIALTIVPVQLGTGLPEQHATLADAPIADGNVKVWTIESDAWRLWQSRADLYAAGPKTLAIAVDPDAGALTFGDGMRGRVPPAAAPIATAHDVTRGARGDLPEARTWTIPGHALNAAQLGEPVPAFVARLAGITNPVPTTGGADAESLDHAAGRAAAALWAHERLVELIAAEGGDTLDQVDRDEVSRRVAPARAVTTLDFERIALSIPGTRIRRARAWAGIDPTYPCIDVVGAVTLVIVPELPAGRPAPSQGLVDAVRRYLHRRRALCTRVVVVGPAYVEVRVRATVRALVGADVTRVRTDVVAALAAFFDPLAGGPGGHGWPFGRDVYRNEVLALIDGVAGVDHVLALELSAGDDTARCGNICVPPTGLTAPGAHAIVVEGA